MADDDFDRDTFEVEIEGQEQRYTGFQSYRLTSNYMTPTDEWEFVVYSEANQFDLRRIWRPLQPVRLYINGACQVIGRIDGHEGVPQSGGALRVFGRDYLADVVDATVDPQFEVQKDWSIEQALEVLLRPFGITKIESSNIDALAVLLGKVAGATLRGKGKRKRNVRLEDFKAEDNLGVGELLSKILARQGYLWLPGKARDEIVIDAPDYDQDPLFSLTRPGNIIDASANRDYRNVPTVTVARGRGNFSNDTATSTRQQYPTWSGDRAPGRELAKSDEVQRILERFDSVSSVIEERADLKSHAVPLPGTLYRPLFYRDQDSRNQEQLDSAVKRMIAERLRDTLTYDVTMRGHVESTSGTVYAVGTIAEVADTIEDVNERLWCFERTLENQENGPRALLKYIRPNSYVLDEPVIFAAASATASATAGKPAAPAPNSNAAAIARQKAALKFVADNFTEEAGPPDLLEGFRR